MTWLVPTMVPRTHDLNMPTCSEAEFRGYSLEIYVAISLSTQDYNNHEAFLSPTKNQWGLKFKAYAIEKSCM